MYLTQTKVELEHKVWLCLYQLKKKHRRKCHLFNCLDSTLEAIYLVRVYVCIYVVVNVCARACVSLSVRSVFRGGLTHSLRRSVGRGRFRRADPFYFGETSDVAVGRLAGVVIVDARVRRRRNTLSFIERKTFVNNPYCILACFLSRFIN